MILDRLEHAGIYFGLHPEFGKAFEFLRQGGLAGLPTGKHAIAGSDIYAMIQTGAGKERGSAQLESHRDFIDIQYLIEGSEEAGWKPVSICRQVHTPYDKEKDIEFYSDAPQTYLSLEPGTFAVFFPGDSHAAMISRGTIRKCVVKVRVGSQSVSPLL